MEREGKEEVRKGRRKGDRERQQGREGRGEPGKEGKKRKRRVVEIEVNLNWKKGFGAKGLKQNAKKSVQVAKDAWALIWDTQAEPERLSSSTCRMWITSSSWPWREVCEEKSSFQIWFHFPKPLHERGELGSKGPRSWYSPPSLPMPFWQKNVSLRFSSLSWSWLYSFEYLYSWVLYFF